MKDIIKYTLMAIGIAAGVVTALGLIVTVGLIIYVIGPDPFFAMIDDLAASVVAVLTGLTTICTFIVSVIGIFTGKLTEISSGSVIKETGESIPYIMNTYTSEGIGTIKAGTVFKETGENVSFYINSASN